MPKKLNPEYRGRIFDLLIDLREERRDWFEDADSGFTLDEKEEALLDMKAINALLDYLGDG